MAPKRPRDDEESAQKDNAPRKVAKQQHNKNDPQRTALATSDDLSATTKLFGSIPPYNTNRARAPANSTSTSNSTETDPLPPLPTLPQGPLSDAVFTHPSFLDDKHVSNSSAKPNKPGSYDRLEFLGDAYIELIATRIIYARYPTLSTGRQAQLREKLVRNSTLAVYSRRYGFNERLRFAGDLRDSLRVKGTPGHAGGMEKVEADVFEAYAAAIVLSAAGGKGFETLEQWLEGCWAGLLLREGPVEMVVNRKDELRGAVVTKEVDVVYKDQDPDGNILDGQLHYSGQVHYVGAYLTERGVILKPRLGSGSSNNRKEATMKAAMDALETSREVIDKYARAKQEDARLRKKMAAETMSNPPAAG